MYRSASPRIARKRAYSEHHVKPLDSGTLSTLTLNRVQSDTDLSRIDKKKTFEQNSTMFQNGELIARVVSALSNMRPTDEDGHSVLEMGMDGGVHGFSDSQILADERSWSRWSLAPSDGSFSQPPKQRRGRAASDFLGLPAHDRILSVNERTWSGNESPILQQMAARNIARSKNNDLYRTAMQPTKNRFDGTNPSVMLSVPTTPEPMSRAINQSLINRLNPFRNRKSSDCGKSHDGGVDMYLQQTNRGRPSVASMPRQYMDNTARGRHSVFSMISQADDPTMEVLEKTTIADLIRALEVVHTKVNTSGGRSDTPLLNNYFDMPKRKLGTASLTPPKVAPLFNLFSPSPENLSRKGSLRPTPGYTTVFSSQAMPQHKQQSTTLSGGTSIMSENVPTFSRQRPPPYTARDSPKPAHRKFSVRATNLNIPPGQAPPNPPSVQQSSTLQRRLSLRPSPLTRDPLTQASGRFTRPNTPSAIQQQQQLSQAGRNLLWRPTQLQVLRTRHGSLAELYERNDRKRTESK